ncbi:hypothetical protein J4210_04955 [Candidatus Woesearchaeota archaeon]|nr:hypothetical protein [Candidatus Woesearchaeota archaeon]
MERKRNKMEIIGDMLVAIQAKGGRIKPTHLMYKANLSYAQLKTYLDQLVEKEFVGEMENDKKNTYIIITDKGDKFIQKLQEMRQFERSFGF